MVDLMTIYERLQKQHRMDSWWPAESPFEVAVGAFLTQNTNWNNVEKALANLRTGAALEVPMMAQMPLPELEALIRPAGFFRQKAQRLQHFCRYLQQHHEGSLETLLRRDLELARNELLALAGIGMETADSILLYAGGRPSFVVDNYTRRLFGRLGIIGGTENYEQIQHMFMAGIPAEVSLYQHYHALIVTHCKERCRKSPLCPTCLCADICNYAVQMA